MRSGTIGFLLNRESKLSKNSKESALVPAWSDQVRLAHGAYRRVQRIPADLDDFWSFVYRRLRQRTPVDKEERPRSEMHSILVVQDRLQYHLQNVISWFGRWNQTGGGRTNLVTV